MEEKIIIESKSKKIFSSPIFIGAVVFMLLLFLYPFIEQIRDPSYSDKPLFYNVFNTSAMWWICWGIALVIAIPFIILYVMINNNKIVVTSKRVYGVATFGKRVDLPLDSVTAVATASLFNGISVATASGLLKFALIENYIEIHEVISKLLMERQEKPIATTIKQEIPQSNADELKKFKDLLDSGIITQEEFDAKKKQLLGL